MADNVMMHWHIVTSAEYAAGTPVDGDLYFLSDTNEIYRGTVSYTQAVAMYETTLPVAPAKNRLYVEKSSLTASMWDGSNWTTVCRGIADTVTLTGNTAVTSRAVAEYVAAEIAKLAESSNLVSDVAYDSAEHTLTVTKGDDSASTVVLAGLGCNLSLANHELQLLDASGNKIGDPIVLDTEKFIQGGTYDADTKTIVLWFDQGVTDPDLATDKIEIPVGDLIDVYTVESTDTVDLTMVANKISAAVKVSAEADNQLVKKADGLYVAPTDVSGKMDKVAAAVEGNVPVFDAEGNVVDSGKTLTEVGGAVLFQGATLEEATAAATPKEGDIAIVTSIIGETDKASKTAYFYHEGSWVAMDGNVNAENVFFAEDLVTTSAIGNITLVNGQATISAAGKNLKQVFDTIFVKEKNPTATKPAVSLTANQNKTYEVGTSVTPSYSASLSAGSYTYGPATGITASSWSVTDTAGHTLTTASGSFDPVVVADNTNYTITATAQYGAGAVPVTNTGNEYPAAQIAAGSASKTSAAIKGYRASFYGTKTSIDDVVDSAFVRGLATKTTAAQANGSKFTITVPAGARRVVFAYPATLRDVTSVLDVGGMNAEIKTAFTMSTVEVEGANNSTAIAYKVYVKDGLPTSAANTFDVTI